ncbi:hypothetical protein CEXT_693491 [Caerostris extrusa]|uniref:Uncharacterized protein n=1 Tax=Caerostris extrusa TaxID=172846 RepID=A0AAV4N449_CAEEX|nr:hypothetical protein CEXT_693491 [Caerostris extrusa]
MADMLWRYAHRSLRSHMDAQVAWKPRQIVCPARCAPSPQKKITPEPMMMILPKYQKCRYRKMSNFVFKKSLKYQYCYSHFLYFALFILKIVFDEQL